MGSGVLALAGRMDADTLPNHALYHLRCVQNCGIIITDMAGKSKGKIREREILNPLGGFRRSVQSGIMNKKNSAKELSP